MRFDKPLVLPIKKIIKENSRVKSFYFQYPFEAKPGQFIMIWIPEYDEKPFGIIVKDNSNFLISVASVGESTKHLHQMKIGERLGIRGPYGTYFNLPSKKGRIALIAGGYGMVPLAYLAKFAADKGYKVDILLGAKTKTEFLKYNWLKGKKIRFFLATDDGSAGFKGFVTDLFTKYLKKNKPIQVYFVGPEIMEKKLADTCYKNKLPFELSVERYIKCGIGVCGQCCVDPYGFRMCVEGPVINQRRLKQISEFGKYKRSASGKVINL